MKTGMWSGGLTGENPPAMWAGTIQLARGQEKNKKVGEKKILPLFPLGHQGSSLYGLQPQTELKYQLPWFPDIKTKMSHTTSILGSPACRLPIMGLLSL